MGYIPLLLMSSFLLLVPGNTLDFTDSISLYIFFGLRGSFPSPCCHTITSFLKMAVTAQYLHSYIGFFFCDAL